MDNKFKKYLPHLVAVLSFILLTSMFFSPLVWGGRALRQGDIQHHEGMSKEIADFREQNHREPLWTNSMFGGMPAYQISVLYPSNFMNPVQKAFAVITRIPFPITSIVLCMIGFYFLMLTFKVDPWVSIAGAIAFGLTSYVITLVPAGHNSKMFAIAYMAPVVMGVIMTFRGRMWLGAAFTTLALALEINANHLQITYYLAILLLFIGLGETIRMFKEGKSKEFWKVAGALVVAVIIAVLPNYSNLKLTNEYLKYTTRGPSELTIDANEHSKTDGLSIDYATQWCYTKSETMTLMIPDFMGGASKAIKDYSPSALKKVDAQWKENIGSQSAYFGDVIFTSGPYYVGAIICFLFVLAMFIVKDKIKWWLFGASVLAIMLAWGHNFMWLTEFFFNYIPGYNKFRAVSMTLVIVNLTFPILAMLAIKQMMDDPGMIKRDMKKFWYSLAITGGVCLLISAAPGAFVDTVNDSQESQIMDAVKQQNLGDDVGYEYIAQLEIARESIVRLDALRSLAFIVCAAGLVFFFTRGKVNKEVLALGMIVLVTFDMWSASHRYIDNDDYEKSKKHQSVYQESEVDKMILADQDKSVRVLNTAADVWQDATTSYYHKSIGGYSAAKLKRIQELYEQVMSKQIDMVDKALASGNDSLVNMTLAQAGTVNMFNTKYVINQYNGVYMNRNANGAAWFVNNVRIVPDADSEIVTLGRINTRTTAVVDKRFAEQLSGFTPKPDDAAKIELVSHAPDHIEYKTNSSVEQVAMFPEVYYPLGWNATLDGKPAEYFCGDYVLRGIRVPAGAHTIVFDFHPESYYTGEKIAMVGSLLVFLALIGGVFMDVRTAKDRKAREEEEKKQKAAEENEEPQSAPSPKNKQSTKSKN